MFKVSFKENSKKVEIFNNNKTIVTLTGKMLLPKFMECHLPDSIQDWVYKHHSVGVHEAYEVSGYYWVIQVKGASLCAEGDTFYNVTGERIAESRAKIRLYKFICTLCHKLNIFYQSILFGYDIDIYDDIDDADCLMHDYLKYENLLDKERHHLNELLQKTIP